MAGFPRRNNEIPLEEFVSESQLALPSNMTDEYVPEPWMKEMLDENAMNSAPLDWDIIDSYSSNNASVGSSMDGSFAMPVSQEAPVTSNAWANQISGQFQTSTNMASDPNVFSFGQSDYQSTCPSLSPETPFLDYSPSLDQFASFDATSTFPSPVTGDTSQVVFDQVAAAFRDLARARAEADPRPLSRKQKQREASIALYLQRLRDTCNEACAMLGSESQQFSQQFDDSMAASQQFPQDPSFEPLMAFFQPGTTPAPTQVNSNSMNYSARPSPDAFTTPTISSSSSPAPPSKKARTAAPVTGGVELVMDLNMNVATTMPRKHKPRTQAQRERYLAVRNQGACEKHKRQHKRCTCVDNVVDAALSKQEQNGVKRSRATRTSRTIRATEQKAEPPRATTTNTTTTQSHQLDNSPGVCVGACRGQCHCFTDNTDDLQWQFLQYSTEQQRQTAVRYQDHRNDGRELHANTSSRGGATPPQPCPPTEKPPRASSDDNSPVTWDIAAVSRNDKRTETQQLQTISVQNTRPDQNRISASAVSNTIAADVNVAANGQLPVVWRNSDSGPSPPRTTRTSSGTISTPHASVESNPLIPQNSGGTGQISTTTQPPLSSTLSTSSSQSTLRSDHNDHPDLRRERHRDRGRIPDRNVVSQTPSEHGQHVHQRLDPDAFIHRHREANVSEPRLAVHSGTLPLSSLGNREDSHQHDRNDALQSSTSSPIFNNMVERGTEHAQKRCSSTGIDVRWDTTAGTHSQRARATSSIQISDAVRLSQTTQYSPAPPPDVSASISVPGSQSRSSRFVLSTSLSLSASSLRDLHDSFPSLTSLSTSISTSLAHIFSAGNSRNSTSESTSRLSLTSKGPDHGTNPLESLGPWLFIWIACLLFSSFVRGVSGGGWSPTPGRMTMDTEILFQRLELV